MPASGPGQQPLLAEQPVDQRRLAGIGAADHGDADRAWWPGLLAAAFAFGIGRLRVGRGHGRIGKRRAQRLVEIGEALAVLGRDRDRLAEPELVGLEHAGPRCPALALVGDQDRRLARAAHEIGKRAVGRQRPARASIRNRIASAPAIAASVCSCMRPLRLSGAASSRPAVSMTANARSPSCARPSRRSRVTPGRSSTSARRRADEAIEQRRLADVGPSDNGDGEAHDRRRLLRMPLCRAAARRTISAAPADRATRPRRPQVAAIRARRRRRLAAVAGWMADQAIESGIAAAIAPGLAVAAGTAGR